MQNQVQFQGDQFFCQQVNIDIPFKKIQYLTIEQVSEKIQKNQIKYLIKRSYKTQGSILVQSFIMQRNKSDFTWLVNKLQQQLDIFVIIPKIDFSQKWINYLNFTNKNNEMQQKQQIQYQLFMIRRFLKIISQISLETIYRKLGNYQSSLFIFIQSQNYQYYKTFQKQQISKQQRVKHTSVSDMIGSVIGSAFGSAKNIIQSYIPQSDYKVNKDNLLEKLLKGISQLIDKGINLQQKNQQFRLHLIKLSQNFMNLSEKLRQKIDALDILLRKLQLKNKQTALIRQQIKLLLQKYNTFDQKEPYMEKQILKYKDFVIKQTNQISKEIRNIGKQFTQLNDQKNLVIIQISDIYQNYKQLKTN